MAKYKAYWVEFYSNGKPKKWVVMNSQVRNGGFWKDEEGRFGGTVLAKSPEEAVEKLIKENQKRERVRPVRLPDGSIDHSIHAPLQNPQREGK